MKQRPIREQAASAKYVERKTVLTAMHIPNDYIITAMGQPLPLH